MEMGGSETEEFGKEEEKEEEDFCLGEMNSSRVMNHFNAIYKRLNYIRAVQIK